MKFKLESLNLQKEVFDIFDFHKKYLVDTSVQVKFVYESRDDGKSRMDPRL